MALLDPYQVDVDGPWSSIQVAHLLRRAGFGGIPSEIEVAVGDGTQLAMEQAVDALVNVLPADPNLDGPAGPRNWGGSFASLPDDDSSEGRTKNPIDLNSLIGHLAYRIFYSSQPLQEQFNLFLHDHFVSTFSRVEQVDRQYQGVDASVARSVLLLKNQNALLRSVGLDSFRETLLRITRDPCMLIFLDNWINGFGEGRAQENYAREVMELFSMGVDNYSEQDVREIAKCLTGETLPNYRDKGAPDAYDYAFRAGNHVRGTKTVFGLQVTEDLTGGELAQVIDLILARVSVQPDVGSLESPYDTLPATAVHMSWKILRWFLNQNVELDPPDPVVLELADYMRGTDDADFPMRRFPYDFRACLRKLFLSQFFYDSSNYFSIVKTPADFCTSTLRITQVAVGRSPEAIEYVHDYTSSESVGRRMRRIGMELFNALDVSGWRHGLAWINAEYLLHRYDFLDQAMRRVSPDAEIDAMNSANGGFLDPNDLEGMLNYFVEIIIQHDIEFWAPGAREQLMAFLNEVASAHSNTAVRFRNQVRGLLLLLMSLPLWQMK